MRTEDAEELNRKRFTRILEKGCAWCANPISLEDHDRFIGIDGSPGLYLRFTCPNGHTSFARMQLEIGRDPRGALPSPTMRAPSGMAWLIPVGVVV